MAFYTKLKWILGILMVFIIIVTTNLIDRNNFVRVRAAVETIYEDRLIAKNLIFEMLKAIQEKEIALAESDAEFFQRKNAEVNAHINSLISKFEQTKLTPEEYTTFRDFKKAVKLLSKAEDKYLRENFTDNNRCKNTLST
ncbi:MAG: MCP four helix bundle domain-containing protein [Leeuwenhoekiella sp.]